MEAIDRIQAVVTAVDSEEFPHAVVSCQDDAQAREVGSLLHDLYGDRAGRPEILDLADVDPRTKGKTLTGLTTSGAPFVLVGAATRIDRVVRLADEKSPVPVLYYNAGGDFCLDGSGWSLATKAPKSTSFTEDHSLAEAKAIQQHAFAELTAEYTDPMDIVLMMSGAAAVDAAKVEARAPGRLLRSMERDRYNFIRMMRNLPAGAAGIALASKYYTAMAAGSGRVGAAWFDYLGAPSRGSSIGSCNLIRCGHVAPGSEAIICLTYGHGAEDKKGEYLDVAMQATCLRVGHPVPKSGWKDDFVGYVHAYASALVPAVTAGRGEGSVLFINPYVSATGKSDMLFAAVKVSLPSDYVPLPPIDCDADPRSFLEVGSAVFMPNVLKSDAIDALRSQGRRAAPAAGTWEDLAAAGTPGFAPLETAVPTASGRVLADA